MQRIAIVTDTNSGITPELAKELGVFLLPMPFILDGEEYLEGVSCTFEEFFQRLAAGSEVSTSQPSPESVTQLWDQILTEYDAIVHIPMSSALSSSCNTARALAQDYDGRVVVVDNKRISVSQLASVRDAVVLAQKGLSAQEICDKLEEASFNCSIYLAVNTLELLKKSGRVTSAGAAIASILGIKPVLQIQGEKLDAFAKVRGMANAKKTIKEAVEKDLKGRFADRKVRVYAAYSGDEAEANEWLSELKEYFGDQTIEMYRLPISICCHVGAGVKAAAAIEYMD